MTAMNKGLQMSTDHHAASRLARGFTLIEVMIVVAIVAILATVALPSYRDYILRGHLVDGTNGLLTMRADMERYFQDNRTYASTGGFNPPCLTARTTDAFTVSCLAAPAASTYVLTAVGRNAATGFTFTLNQADARDTTAVPTGWGTPNSGCWLMKRGQTC